MKPPTLVIFGTLTLLLLSTLTGCQSTVVTPTPVLVSDPCAFAHNAEIGLGTTDEGGLQDWVQQHDGRSWQGAISDGASGIADFSWNQDGRRWSARFKNGKLVRVSQFGIENGPSFGQIVKGLGAPAFIYGYVGIICEKDCNYSLGFDYPQLGVSVYRSATETAREVRKSGEPALVIQQDVRITEMHCYTPASSLEVALRDAFGMSDQSVAVQMSARSSWRGFGSLVPLGPR